MLRAEHITKQYSLPDSGHTVFDAVSDVSLELKDGCVSSLVGESGSGKSTLARVLSYIEMPDIGKVFLGDLEVTSCKRKEIRSVRGKVQLVMQMLWSSIFVTLVAKKYHESVTLPSGLRMVYDNH